MQHIIKKQVIELSLQKKLDAFNIQQQMSADYWNSVILLLEKVFDDISATDEAISIDTLEVDLGTFSEREIERGEWQEALAKKITEQLLPLKHRLSSQLKVQRKAASLGFAEQWLFYMHHGFLPWNVLKIDDKWYQQALEAFAGDTSAIEKLRRLINTDSTALRRIVMRHGYNFLVALVETLTAKSQVEMPLLLKQIISDKRDLLKNIPTISLEQQLWYRVVKIAASGQGLTTDEIAKQVEDNISIPDKYFDEILKEGDLKKSIDDGIYVSNAGMVLLHPFLPGFFRAMGLVERNEFIDSYTHQKAVVMLHYMAAGNIAVEEHELVISKMLCAFPLDEPVSVSIDISDQEKQEAEDVLRSVIAQWEILEGTSIEGLRESFLQRSGKLYVKNDQPQLQIEASAIDVLLDHLPWSLSMIMLPWMKNLLRVEWR